MYTKKLMLITTAPETLYYLLANQIKSFTAEGFQIYLVTSKGEWISSEQVSLKYNLSVTTIPFSRRFSPLRDCWILMKMVLLLHKVKPDIMHVSTPKASLISSIAGWITKVPLRIYTIRGLIYYGKKGIWKTILMNLERITCRLVHVCTINSRSNLEYIIKHSISTHNKVRILGNGSSQGVDAQNLYNPDRITEKEKLVIRDKYLIPNNYCIFGFVGRIVRDKGIEELLDAWDVVQKEIPSSQLLIIGPEHEPRDNIGKNYLNKLKNDPTITFCGSVVSPLKYYAIMDIFVFPSHREGFPNVVLEASAMGLPVITTNAPGCVDSIVDKETGEIFSTGNTDELINKMVLLGKNQQLRRNYGEQARCRVLSDFRPEDISKALIKLYKNY
jgi:glycosyltransferase involved in cell wall biosynthesis